MFRRTFAVCLSVLFAFAILAISIFRLSTPKYSFYVPADRNAGDYFETDVGYFFPSPGIGPDSPFWLAKAARDKVWLTFTLDHQKRAYLLLLFADKRVVTSERLMREGKSSLAVLTADKAEQYLRDAYQEVDQSQKNGEDVNELLTTLAMASLRHRETLEYVATIAPQDAIPLLVTITNTPKTVYENCIQKLIQNGKPTLTPQLNISKKS